MESGEKVQPESTPQPERFGNGAAVKTKEGKSSTAASHWYWFVILFLILAVGGMYLWKNMAVSKARTEVASKATAVIGEQNRSYLRLVATPLVWAVRSELLRDNYDQINQYLAQFVKEKHMKELVVARTDGKVVAATNKKLEGSNISTSFPAEITQITETTITVGDNGDYLVVTPVMGLNTRLGVLVLVYSPPAFVVK